MITKIKILAAMVLSISLFSESLDFEDTHHNTNFNVEKGAFAERAEPFSFNYPAAAQDSLEPLAQAISPFLALATMLSVGYATNQKHWQQTSAHQDRQVVVDVKGSR